MKKPNFRRLKFSTLFYFLSFTVVIIASVWIFQFVFLETYYSNAKFLTMREYAEKITAKMLRGEDFSSEIDECKDVGIVAAVISKNEFDDNYVNLINPAMKIDDGLASEAENAFISHSAASQTGKYKASDSRRGMLYYIQAVEYRGEQAYLLLFSPYAKLYEAINVLKIQSAAITLITLVISLALAWYFSGKLTKPIGEMSDTAKRWAEGDNSVTFTASDTYTEISELAEALNYAKDGVSKSGELQRDLLANISHDLKTPLTMIKAYAEMINDISGNDKVKREKHTKVIIDEADRLTNLVNDILNLSKLQSSVDDLEMTEINLSALTERVIGRFSDYVGDKGYKIEEYIAPDLITYADEKKVEQVIYNLLGNSLNYTGEDKTVKVYLTAENDKILLEIIDSGKGIKAEAMDTIWERYYRFSETNTRPVKGTGLGLSIVKAILENHKLKYGVRSKEDCGSNFFVEFNRIKNE